MKIDVSFLFPTDIAGIIGEYTEDYMELYSKHQSLRTHHWSLLNNWLNLLVEISTTQELQKLFIMCAIFEHHLNLLQSIRDVNISDFQLYGLAILHSVMPHSLEMNPFGLAPIDFISYITEGLYNDAEQIENVLRSVGTITNGCDYSLFRILIEQSSHLPFSVLASDKSVQALRYANNLAVMYQWDYRDIGIYWCLSLSLATKTKVPLSLYQTQASSFQRVYPDFPLNAFHGIGKASVSILGVEKISDLKKLSYLHKPKAFHPITWNYLLAYP